MQLNDDDRAKLADRRLEVLSDIEVADDVEQEGMGEVRRRRVTRAAAAPIKMAALLRFMFWLLGCTVRPVRHTGQSSACANVMTEA